MAQIKTNLQYGVTGSLQTGSIAGDAIDGTKIADDAINSEHLAAGGIDTAHIADDQITLAKMASGTDGNVITYDASGNPAVVAVGTSGHFLKSQGAGSVPVFAAAGGGKVLNVVTASFAGQVGTTSTSWADTGIAASITPASTSNKVLVMVNFTVHNSQADYGNFQTIFRGDSSGTNLGTDATGLGRVQGRASLYHMCSMHILDSPSTTSSQAYETGFKNSTTSLASYTMINNITAKITLMEIDGT